MKFDQKKENKRQVIEKQRLNAIKKLSNRVIGRVESRLAYDRESAAIEEEKSKPLSIATFKSSSCIGRRDIPGFETTVPVKSPRWLPYHPPKHSVLDFSDRYQAS